MLLVASLFTLSTLVSGPCPRWSSEVDDARTALSNSPRKSLCAPRPFNGSQHSTERRDETRDGSRSLKHQSMAFDMTNCVTSRSTHNPSRACDPTNDFDNSGMLGENDVTQNVRATRQDLRELPHELAIPDNARLRKRHAMPPAIDKDRTRERPSRMNGYHLKRPLHVPACRHHAHYTSRSNETQIILDTDLDLELDPSPPRGTSHDTLGHDARHTTHGATYKTQSVQHPKIYLTSPNLDSKTRCSSTVTTRSQRSPPPQACEIS